MIVLWAAVRMENQYAGRSLTMLKIGLKGVRTVRRARGTHPFPQIPRTRNMRNTRRVWSTLIGVAEQASSPPNIR